MGEGGSGVSRTGDGAREKQTMAARIGISVRNTLGDVGLRKDGKRSVRLSQRRICQRWRDSGLRSKQQSRGVGGKERRGRSLVWSKEVDAWLGGFRARETKRARRLTEQFGADGADGAPTRTVAQSASLWGARCSTWEMR